MKRVCCILLALALVLSLWACGAGETPTVPVTETWADAIHIALGDTVTVTGDTAGAVYTDTDIVYYEAGHDVTYGEGTEADAHTPRRPPGTRWCTSPDPAPTWSRVPWHWAKSP